jgi:hypothetical protein
MLRDATAWQSTDDIWSGGWKFASRKRLLPRHSVPVVSILSYIPAFGGSASASALPVDSGKATCKQLPKSQIQPVLSVPIGKVSVTAALQTGQQCVYSKGAGSDDGVDIDVLVFNGSQAKPEFQQEVKGWGPKVAVKGIGDKAYRKKGDYQIDSIKGSEFCSVSVGSDETVPGVSALETNGTDDIPESADTIIASALGTICNRIYGKGNTKASLKGLSALIPATTGS